MLKKYSTYQLATCIAILFHTIGLVGILFVDKEFFAGLTSYNLLLTFILIIWTQQQKNVGFYTFLIASFLIGYFAEVIGVNTGMLFGEYAYGDNLGWKLLNVPLIIGINWFVIICTCGITITALLQKIINRTTSESSISPKTLKALSVVVDGATLAVFFDWVMEPVAVALGYWKWTTPEIPFYNYVCWFVVSVILLLIFHYTNFVKQNKFAVHLLLIQFMFFLLLRTFLK